MYTHRRKYFDQFSVLYTFFVVNHPFFDQARIQKYFKGGEKTRGVEMKMEKVQVYTHYKQKLS